MVHEEGHMLGLGHAGPYNFNVNVFLQQFSPYDNYLWSIMSYIQPGDQFARFFRDYPVTGTNWGTVDGRKPEPTTPMMLDILAAQRIYGAPTSGPLTTGNTTFGFNSNLTGAIKPFFDFTQNKNPVITVFDTGPNNTLDLSGFTGGATINLNPGSFTSAGQDDNGNAMVNNIGIAFGTDINNAVGTSSGFDRFIPNPDIKGTLTAGGGTNQFMSTESGLSGYTLSNLKTGDATINFTDANPSTFSYTWNSTTLNYGGSALTTLANGISSPTGRFIQTPDPSSGV
jgi:hypothetical protein